jgi:hypothetical protein
MSTQSTATVTKAYLLIEESQQLECWFNPTTLALRRAASWTEDQSAATLGQGTTKPAFLGGEGDVITLNLLLHVDDTRTGDELSENLDALLALVDATETSTRGQLRPPTITVHWGSFVSCIMIARSVDVTVELFDVDGTPLRAIVNLGLTQFEPEPGQAAPKGTNPTTRATQGRRVHHVKPRESIHLIAHHHLRDPARWREIAEANGLDDPLSIRAGDVLVVPVEDR